MDEKRRYERLPASDKTKISKPNGQADVKLIDISLGGMRVLMDEDIACGTYLQGQFSILSNAGPFYINGEVSWSKQAQAKDAPYTHEIGIRFTKISTIPLE